MEISNKDVSRSASNGMEENTKNQYVKNSTVAKSAMADKEEKVLEFWKENDIFEKTLSMSKGRKEFVFYEGPPTANGKPGIHHLEARAFKDAIPRYKTMRGFYVRRKGGWDTHGLPVELQVEKELGLTSKKEIEEYGVEKFNQKCKESVWQYRDLWEKFTERVGYWIDSKNPYVTYENQYMESVWNILSTVEKKGLLYKDYKVLPWCPRCGTALSSHELAQGYQDDKDLSVTAKFKVVGEENTYFLAWTTTPWTLPGNIALAVGKDIFYVKVKLENDFLILAEDRLSILDGDVEISEKIKGSDLVGKEYEPLYAYFNNLAPESLDKSKAYKVYSADFVNTEDGTGIVHTAVMYGQDDFALGTKVGLPKFHLVKEDGHYIDGMDFLTGRFVKDEEVAIDIIKDLAGRNLLFKKEKYEHSYPHCWRCKTALIYYARDSWYIRMEKLRDKLVKENESINWEPEHIKDGRFGEWLRGLKDWAISRERYWGTPLPIWESSDGDRIVVDSIATLRKLSKKGNNKYFVMRHGGTESNKSGVVSYIREGQDGLTEEGKEETKKKAQSLKGSGIGLIITSPFRRTLETGEIVRETLGLEEGALIKDERLQEINPGIFDGKNWSDFHDAIEGSDKDWFNRKVEGGESLLEVGQRVRKALLDCEEKYKGKKILFVTHGGPAWLFYVNAGLFAPHGEDYQKEDHKVFVEDFKRFENSEVRDLEFIKMPMNQNLEIDLHKPFIDSVVLEKGGKEYTRVKEVLDVWFDSGSMPFAEEHYPFENSEKTFQPYKGLFRKQRGYPADFISEGIDQTRGWFYTLHAIGGIMGTGKAYRNVISLGLILDANGKKMSKSIGNTVDPIEMVEKYGVDTLRLWMYSVNQPGDAKNFDEKTVLDLNRKFFGLLYNVLAFYELYPVPEQVRYGAGRDLSESKNILDKWIVSRLEELVSVTTINMDNFKLFEPVREMRSFIDDLSTWYLRRSRDRLKDGDNDAKRTLYYVLKTLAKLMAPFAPFSAEDIWQRLKTDNDVESVHLTSWPEARKVNTQIISDMQKVRDLCTEGNSIRKKTNIPLRQPLQTFFVKEEVSQDLKDLIKEELNVKEVKVSSEVSFDMNITPELKREGEYRELVRVIQDMRKEKGLIPSDVINLTLPEKYKETVSGFEDDLKKTAGVKEIKFMGEEIILK